MPLADVCIFFIYSCFFFYQDHRPAAASTILHFYFCRHASERPCASSVRLHLRLRLSHLSPQRTHSNTMGCLVCALHGLENRLCMLFCPFLHPVVHVISESRRQSEWRGLQPGWPRRVGPPTPHTPIFPSPPLRFPKLEFCPTWFIWSMFFFSYLGFKLGDLLAILYLPKATQNWKLAQTSCLPPRSYQRLF